MYFLLLLPLDSDSFLLMFKMAVAYKKPFLFHVKCVKMKLFPVYA